MFDGAAATWRASLVLRVSHNGGRSRIATAHRGPLRLQKALYPEGPSPCHAVMLHPPGGIAGGDALQIGMHVDRGAHALLTTPGATKWYKANGRGASQQVALNVAGVLEWLPQEAIVYDHASVASAIDIDLHGSARMIGWDIVALGRKASGETFGQGCFAQMIRLHVDGELRWAERTRVRGDDALLNSPIGLAGRHVFGCLWAAGPCFDNDDIDRLRAKLGDVARAAPLTRPATGVLVARALGSSTMEVRALLTAVWRALRPLVCGREAVLPRVWAT